MELLTSYTKDDKEKMNLDLIKLDTISQKKTKTQFHFKKAFSSIMDTEY